MFHALSGRATVSSLVSYGEKTPWAVWNVFPELTGELLKLSLRGAADLLRDLSLSCITD